MRDKIEIGPVPYNEDCQQVGSADYNPIQAKEECQRFIRNIRHVLGEEPVGARLTISSNAHEFGNYYEVVCWYEDDLEETFTYALRCESEAPATWLIP